MIEGGPIIFRATTAHPRPRHVLTQCEVLELIILGDDRRRGKSPS
jgi:hypothetical protein